MKNKDLYKNVIRVLDELPQDRTVFEYKNGVKLLGNSVLWDEVYKWISENVSHRIILPGSSELTLHKPEDVKAIRQDLVEMIEDIEEGEEDAELQRQERKSNIQSNRHSVIIAYIALVISILATTPLPERLYKWIAELICGLF